MNNDPGDNIRRELARRLELAGFLLVSEIRRNLNRSQPYVRTGPGGQNFRGLDPSRPGEFPKKLSGQLIKSIAHTVDANKLVLTVGTAIKHGKFLEHGTRRMDPRPWLVRTYTTVRDRISRLLGGR